MNIVISSIFKNRVDANAAFDELIDSGIERKEISVIMKEDKKIDTVNQDATVGATSGGIVGGIAGILIGISAIAIPGIGPIVIGGPIISALGLTGAAAAATTAISGGVVGALAGGLIGSLAGLGLSQEEAKLYEERIKKGGVVLFVNTNSDNEDVVKRTLTHHHANEVKTLGEKERELA